MARKPNLTPDLKRHKASGLYYIFLGGKRTYLGRDEVKAEEERRRIIALHLGASLEPAPPQAGGSRPLYVSEAILLYERHLRAKRNDSRELARAITALDAVCGLYGQRPLAEFRGKALKHVRSVLIHQSAKTSGKKKLSRNYVNKLVAEIKTAWEWLVSEDMASGEALIAMRAVDSLRQGEGGVELARVSAVEAETVRATLPHCNYVVKAMIEVQLLTGMRPGEVCDMRRADMSLDPSERLDLPNTRPTVRVSAIAVENQLIWLYVPERHKNLKRGKHRVIPIGPTAQRLLAPFLDRPPEAPLFSPREAMLALRAAKGQSKKSAKGRQWRDAYDANAYAHSIRKAIRQANKQRMGAKLKATQRQDAGLALNAEQLAALTLEPLPDWSPNMLRHRAATEAEENQQGAAQDLLGHASPDMTATYLERILRRAAAHAAKLG